MSKVNSNNIKVVIPARYASTRLPAKPTIPLHGTPMIVHVAKRVSEALPSIEVIVATDHPDVVEVVERAGLQTILTSTHHVSGTDRINEVACKYQWSEDTIVINVQGDEPLIEAELLQNFVQFCQSQATFTMASVMATVPSIEDVLNPNVVKVVVDNQQKALCFSRSAIPYIRDQAQDNWPLDIFKRHVGIYGYSVSVLSRLSIAQPSALETCEKLEQLRALDMDIPIYMMVWSGDIHGGVDTPEDVGRVERVLQL